MVSLSLSLSLRPGGVVNILRILHPLPRVNPIRAGFGEILSVCLKEPITCNVEQKSLVTVQFQIQIQNTLGFGRKNYLVAFSIPDLMNIGFSTLFQVALQAAVCVEEASTCKALARVFLRSSGRTVAVGVVTRVIEDQA